MATSWSLRLGESRRDRVRLVREEEWQTTVWELNITKRPTTRPATSSQLEPSQHQDNMRSRVEEED